MILDVNRTNSQTQNISLIDNGNREDETNDNQQSTLLGNADLYEHSFISSDSNSSECEVNSTTNSSSTGIENVSSLQHAWSENESLMLYTNADSLMNKKKRRDELETLISINKYDIVVITEADLFTPTHFAYFLRFWAQNYALRITIYKTTPMRKSRFFNKFWSILMFSSPMVHNHMTNNWISHASVSMLGPINPKTAQV